MVWRWCQNRYFPLKALRLGIKHQYFFTTNRNLSVAWRIENCQKEMSSNVWSDLCLFIILSYFTWFTSSFLPILDCIYLGNTLVQLLVFKTFNFWDVLLLLFKRKKGVSIKTHFLYLKVRYWYCIWNQALISALISKPFKG